MENPKPTFPQLMDVSELAQYLRLSHQAIYSMCYRRELPFIKIGRRLRFSPEAIAEFLKDKANSERL